MDFLSETFVETVAEPAVTRNLLATAALLLVILIVRSVALRGVRRAKWASEPILLRWTAQVRWATLLLLVLGLLVIWSSELRTLALSVVAIAAAIVIATKELIMCVSGSILRATSRAFSAGDRIEFNGIRGDVIELGALTTTILEIGPVHRRTGRAVVIPNSLLFSAVLTNETVTDAFVLHTIKVPVPVERLAQAETRLLAAGNEVCAPIVDDARSNMNRTARRHNLPVLPVEPIVSLEFPDANTCNLLLRVPARAREKGTVEQEILRRFFQLETSGRGGTVP